MFDNRRYATCGVQEKIPNEVQLALWALLENLKLTGRKLDYWEIFQLSGKTDEQKIVHTQENPPYKCEVTQILSNRSPVTAKIFIVDDGAQSVMMLAEEH